MASRLLFTMLAGCIAAPLSGGTPTIDGTLDGAAGYQNVVGYGPTTRTGQGTSNDASAIYFTSDATNLYFFVRGQGNTTSANNALMFFLNTDKQTGAAAGASIGAIAGAPDLPWSSTDTTRNQWKTAIEVDHIWMGRTGATTTNWTVNKASYVGTPSESQIGQVTSQSGVSTTFGNGEVHAMNNSGGAATGWEFSVPRASLGTIADSNSVQCMVVALDRSTVNFSDDSAPAATAPGNPALNANLNSSMPTPISFVISVGPGNLVESGATWKYLVTPSAPAANWTQSGFDDSGWATGTAKLGYGGKGEVTTIGYGGNASAKYTTTYFRKTFTVANTAAVLSPKILLMRDDGAVVYLNGTEVARSNIAAGTVAYSTFASGAGDATQERTFYSYAVSPSLLVNGTNIISAEVHQADLGSSDLGFDLTFGSSDTGAAPPVVPAIARGPYLMMGTPSSVTVRFRTTSAVQGKVSYGASPASLTSSASGPVTATTEHVIALNGLTPNTTYYYSVGFGSTTLAGGDSTFSFTTAPPIGTRQKVRFWALGDTGTKDANQQAVRNAFYTFNGSQKLDFWMLLGDNAYDSGTDAEYQAAIFNMYPATLKQSVLWPTIGNHDAVSANSPTQTGAYYDMFTMPTAAQAGGTASGTEAYYSFDYGNIHVVCLDSEESPRTVGGSMLTWLENDLSQTSQEWIIAFWHQPPYSKANHDSDTTVIETEMRQNALPILESHGVDLVLCGHCHSYERSFLINGHYGLSSSMTPAMKKDGGSGRVDGTGAYTKPGGTTANNGAVYVVAGSSGKVDPLSSLHGMNHPAMFTSLLSMGSVFVEIDGSKMDLKFITNTGAVSDYFTLTKNQADVTKWDSYDTSKAQGR